MTLEGTLGPAERRALSDRFGLVEGTDIWFEELQAEGDPGKSGSFSLALPGAAKKSG